MSDLINRQDAIDAIESKKANEFGNYVEYNVAFNDGLCSAVFALEELPSAERKRGEWIAYNGDDTNWLRNDGSPVFMQCSECNTMVVNNFAFNWNFCPNCGSAMRGDEDER